MNPIPYPVSIIGNPIDRAYANMNSWKNISDNVMTWVINPAGITATGIASYRYTPSNIFRTGYYRNAKEVQYSLSILKKGANGKYINGIQEYRNGLMYAKNAANSISKIGANIARIGLVYDAYSLYRNPNWLSGAEMIINVSGVFYWPIPAVYHGGKLFYLGIQNYVDTMFENDLVPGRDDISIWK